jgi:hypothetical protein
MLTDPAAANDIGAMTEPELSNEETRTLIDHARRKFDEERWPLSPALRPVREIMEKLDPKKGRSVSRCLADGEEAEAIIR